MRFLSNVGFLGNVGWVLAFGVVHFLLYWVFFGVAFGLGDARQPVPWGIAGPTLVLGFPLLYVMNAFPASWPWVWWLGSDTNGLVVWFATNSLLWGCALTGLLRGRQRRRRAAGRSRSSAGRRDP